MLNLFGFASLSKLLRSRWWPGRAVKQWAEVGSGTRICSIRRWKWFCGLSTLFRLYLNEPLLLGKLFSDTLNCHIFYNCLLLLQYSASFKRTYRLLEIFHPMNKISDDKPREKQGQTCRQEVRGFKEKVTLVGIDVQRELDTNCVSCLFIWMSLYGETR